jgi:uncharacterized membrane protein YphA (DoxX/SURF4 family)
MMQFVIFIATILLTIMFLLSGIHKAFTFDKTTAGFAKKFKTSFGIAKLIIMAVIILEIVAPLVLSTYSLLSPRMLKPFVKISIIALIVFTVLCNALYHFPMEGKNYYSFMSNLSTIGGLILLFVYFA